MHRESKRCYWFKYTVEWFLAFMVFLLVWPLILFIGMLIIVQDLFNGGPLMSPFYLEPRISAGKTIKMIKFRIIKSSALKEIKDKEDGQISMIKLYEKDENAISKIGVLLRDYYIDELPQFINVLKGDMAIVGIRPIPLIDDDRIKRFGYTKMRGGLTGIFQVNKGSTRSMTDMDQEYYELFKTLPAMRLFFYDCKLMFKTVFKMSKGEGL